MSGAGAETSSLGINLLIGFAGNVPSGLVVHPSQRYIIYPLGNTVIVREVGNPKNQTFLQGHSDRVSTIAVSRSGRYIASGQVTHMGFQADVLIWDFEERKLLHRCTLHKAKVQALAFSPQDTYLTSLGGEDDNAVVVWHVESGKPICGSPAANDHALAIKWSNNNEVMFMTAGKYNMRIWQFDLENRKIRPTDCDLGKIKRVITCLVLDPNDEFAYCGTESGDLLQVSVERKLYKASGPPKTRFSRGIQTVSMAPSGDIVVGGGDGTLAVLKSDTFKILRQTTVMGGVTSIQVYGDGSTFFCGTKESNVYEVGYGTLDAKLLWSCHYQRVNSVVFPNAYSKLFATASIGEIRVWNAQTSQELLRITVPNVECLALVFPQDGKAIISGWSDGKVRAFTPQTGKLKWTINDAHTKAVTALAITSDGERLITGGGDGQVRVWRVGTESREMIASMKEHKGTVTSVVLSRDDNDCVSASADGSCIIWDLSRFVRLKALFESTFFKAALYHPDEAQILTTGTDRKLAYWDAYDGNAIREVEGSRTSEINTLAISADGDTFVSGGGDKVVKVWNYDEGICYFTGLGHSGAILRVAISPDSQRIVSVGEEGAIFVWNNPMVSP
eukprot:TRINITY_DN8273_c0_g1_i1.p1 TRINITY_DN8273_c0_g1~~TRINITY_DN8273_c0_g1_i1.p1  ORF type:complete len:617 (+),score=142.57 TRINITY_DN8273_c0_g1_i1:20-1870(+)